MVHFALGRPLSPGGLGQVGQGLGEELEQEQHHGQMHYELQEGEAHNVACEEVQHTEQRQHPKGVDQIGSDSAAL